MFFILVQPKKITEKISGMRVKSTIQTSLSYTKASLFWNYPLIYQLGRITINDNISKNDQCQSNHQYFGPDCILPFC